MPHVSHIRLVFLVLRTVCALDDLEAVPVVEALRHPHRSSDCASSAGVLRAEPTVIGPWPPLLSTGLTGTRLRGHGMSSYGARLSRSRAVTASLSALSDDQLREAVGEGTPLAVGIGGSTSRVQVNGTPVFVKRVALTDLERLPANARSTADPHGLPLEYHYGVGSAGVGAWREAEAHLLADQWVRTGDCEHFPLLHHWRVLDGPGDGRASASDDLDVPDMVAFWHDSPAVRQRLTALAEASAGLYLFLEHVPQTLDRWLSARLAEGSHAVDAVCDKVAEDLLATASFLAQRGLLHFDAHFRNILMDGERLYFSDFGLALSPAFATTDDEARIVHEHRDHDIAYVARELVNWLVEAFTEQASAWTDATERNALVRRYAEGHAPLPLPDRAAALVARLAPVAVVMNDFYLHLHHTSRHTAFPTRDVRAACQTAGLIQ